MIYNKESSLKGGRRLSSTGPRNVQSRASIVNNASEDIKELKAEIIKLANSSNIVSSGYSQQQVDDMLNEAIAEVSIELEKKYIQNIKQLELKIVEITTTMDKMELVLDKKEAVLESKDNIILSLTDKITKLSSLTGSAPSISNTQSEEGSDRPSMDDIFIDPSKKGAEDKMESHVKIKEIKYNSNTEANINKLKNLMDKLPKK